MTQSIQVIVHRVESLDDVEHMGKNDPYVQLTTDLAEKESFKKTTVKKNAGRNAEYEEHLTLENFQPQHDNYLYVEVLESDVGIDPPIGFTAIPMFQVTEAPQHALKGTFQLYTPSGKEKGTVTLSIFIVAPGQPAPQIQLHEVRGKTEIVSEQKKRIETMKTNEKINDVGAAAAILGALYGAKKMHDASKKPKNIEA
ncbi:hypothetical protein BG006_006194 [Podila minutissima]|uniref:C2 domain-containing protein n=1 Tax=Podila minutissima TaxID=64525 RepID=A0A9P5VLL4_9FUNG|nr:hypothetical protein BG006_006194 [Podila minutissima]